MALLCSSRMGAHEEANNTKKSLCLGDLGGFRRETMSAFEGLLYVAMVMHEKYQKRKESFPTPRRSSACPSRPRCPRGGVSSRRGHPPRCHSWQEDEESWTVKKKRSRTPCPRPRKRPRREDSPRPSSTRRQMRPPQKKPVKKDTGRFHPEELLRELRDWIELGLGGENLLPVCQKMLTATDVNPHHKRLLIPMDRMVSLAFLEEEERLTVEFPSTKGVERGVPVRVISHPSLQQRMLSLRRWVMKKRNGTASEAYVLTTSGWAGVVKDNDLKAGEVIQIWSYRVKGQLHMLVISVGEAAEALEDGN